MKTEEHKSSAKIPARLDDAILRIRKCISVRDLAQLASVDASTVSRALNHDPRVSDERAQAIRKIAQQVGYRPRPLRSKLARSIGILLTYSGTRPIANQYQERITWHAQQLLGQRRLHVNVERVSKELLDGKVQLPAIVQQNRVDGVLLAGHPSVELVQQIRTLGMPAVAINDAMARLGISCVRSEPGPAIHQAILELAARGHQQFGLLMISIGFPTVQARYDSYIASLKEIGIDPDPAWLVCDLPDGVAAGREGVRELLKRGRLPTAIICENDWVAVGAMHELQRQGILVPQDVSVIGHDDLWVCEQVEPKLTSIHRAEDQMVATAMDLLMEQIDNGTEVVREVRVEGAMVWRESTGTAPGRRVVTDRSNSPLNSLT